MITRKQVKWLKKSPLCLQERVAEALASADNSVLEEARYG